jgi:hypothetical protein
MAEKLQDRYLKFVAAWMAQGIIWYYVVRVASIIVLIYMAFHYGCHFEKN